jgi:isoaspartyl peptidase/L-asparaginase-like protein (Ntn-hydrolase superfamily)
MENTDHVMLAGDQARRFAISQGFRPQNLMTAENVRRYDEWKLSPAAVEREYVHAKDEHYGDTVTMIGWETPGHLVAASSTSGLAWKLPGRVGDSPIIGAGIYADDYAGAAGATGLGEELWKAAASFRTVEFMRQGRSAQEACEATVLHMLRRQPKSISMMCVVFAAATDGTFGAATTVGEFPMWICVDGKIEMRKYGVPNS